MAVSYDSVDNFEGMGGAPALFKALLSQYGLKRILEVGSGANPTLSPNDVRAMSLSYVTSDISPEELAKADSAFEPMLLDMTAEIIEPSLVGTFDCVASRMVGEHIRDGHRYHSNIYKLLRPGGISVQCCSTLWALPFLANRLLPEALANIALDLFNPRDRHRHEKFPAYYSWSRGPTKAILRDFQRLGFEIVRYTGYFGHPYHQRVPFLNRLEAWKSSQLLRHPIPQLCAYATIVLRKPY